MDVKDYVINQSVIRDIFFNNDDLAFVVEGYEFESDMLRETDYEPEFEGDTFHEVYTDFIKAIEKYIELVKAGWEIVEFRIRLKKGSTIRNLGYDFVFVSQKEKSTLKISINTTKLCEIYAKKIAKIQEIIESGEI